MTQERTFVGFGFGAIQAGLFLYEAHRAGTFGRLVVAEVLPEVVEAVRGNGGAYGLNIAHADRIEQARVDGVTILNPLVPEDRGRLVELLAEADEVATALPSINFYDTGKPTDVAAILGDALAMRREKGVDVRTVFYTAENHNHAAEALEETMAKRGGGAPAETICFLNTVIGKMSGVVTDSGQMREQNLLPIAPGLERAFLVEAFNRILVSRVPWSGFTRGMAVFQEKPDLLPFEEAKLYGHNATHALLGYTAAMRGLATMADAGATPDLRAFARDAFLEESGRALCRKHAGVDALFTQEGYMAYVDDLMDRMSNPFLRDTVERITRDPLRKLGWDDRLVGTMRVAMAQGVEPARYAVGAAAALAMVRAEDARDPGRILDELWNGGRRAAEEAGEVKRRILDADLSVVR